MAQCRSNVKIGDTLQVKNLSKTKRSPGCESFQDKYAIVKLEVESPKRKGRPPGSKSITKTAQVILSKHKLGKRKPNVAKKEISLASHSNMKPKAKDEDKTDNDTVPELAAKTRARKKLAAETAEEDKIKTPQETDIKSSSVRETNPKKPVNSRTVTPKTAISKRPLGIKTLRNKTVVIPKDKLINAIKHTRRGRKPASKSDNNQASSQAKETIALIPASEIKKEPIDEGSPSSRSSSPKTAGRRPRISSDMLMMKSVLGDSLGNLVTVGSRTSPYSMRSERSSSPSVTDSKNVRGNRPRKLKNNLLNEIVRNEERKRRRLLSDSKAGESSEVVEDIKKLKRDRSCSRDGSELSKCSDITESDVSLSESTSNDVDCRTESKEILKKVDKCKTELEVANEDNLQISTESEKVPSLNVDSKFNNVNSDTESINILNEKSKKMLSLKRSTSLDSDNNNSNRLKLINLHNSSDIEDKFNFTMKTENDALSTARSSILTNMSKAFNSKEVSKNIRRARRGRRAACGSVRSSIQKSASRLSLNHSSGNDTTVSGTEETLETISKEINDLIQTLDIDITESTEKTDSKNETVTSVSLEISNSNNNLHAKPVGKFYGSIDSKPLTDSNSILITQEVQLTPKEKENNKLLTNEAKVEDEDDIIRLHFEDVDSSPDKSKDSVKENIKEVAYKSSSVASIDKLMDRLKNFEEFDKKRNEILTKTGDTPVMVKNDVVLITKSGADIKPLKDMQMSRSPEKPLEKENLLSCLENNSAISILKKDHARKSIDVDLPNSVTFIKRNNVNSRKESTSSSHSKESLDAISIFEKSLGKDVTLTEIRKSIEKSNVPAPVEPVHQFATLHPNNPISCTPALIGVIIDPQQISIGPRVISDLQLKQVNSVDTQRTKPTVTDISLRKSSESLCEQTTENMATIERIKSPSIISNHQVRSPDFNIMSPPPVSVKSPEGVQTPTEPLHAPVDNAKAVLPEIVVPVNNQIYITKEQDDKQKSDDVCKSPITEPTIKEIKTDLEEAVLETKTVKEDSKKQIGMAAISKSEDAVIKPELSIKPMTTEQKEIKSIESNLKISENLTQVEVKTTVQPTRVKPTSVKSPRKSAGKSSSAPGSSSGDSPESQRRKEFFRNLGLLTHKAAKEAKIGQQREREKAWATSYGDLCGNKNKSAKKSADYTGTLKTVIKLSRSSSEPEKKKVRSSLKITFQKSKNRTGKPTPEVGDSVTEEDAYYTIERKEGAIPSVAADASHRKSHYSNRLSNHEIQAQDTIAEPAALDVPKETTLNLVIPEKASSFSIHPGRLCMDQCFYCGGKFGLFDTPCHIAQMKSHERQKKVLDNEEKLTIDSCLCDACYRHVDRRANCPSYRKRPVGSKTSLGDVREPGTDGQATSMSVEEKSVSPPIREVESDDDAAANRVSGASSRPSKCHTEGCMAIADHSIRRKWLIKMRNSVNKVLKLELDYPGLHTIPLCGDHYRVLLPLMACVLCSRRLTKHHNIHFIHHGYMELNPLLSDAGIPVKFTERPVLCKMCRYYCSLLQRPQHNIKLARTYRRRLLHVHNIEAPPDSEPETEETSATEEENIAKQKKKIKNGKAKQRKPSDGSKPVESDTSANCQEVVKEEPVEPQQKPQNMEEDIESLISSNKILVPTASKSTEVSMQSDTSDTEVIAGFEAPVIPLDKQSELQYLLQKQNNPAQFMQKPRPNLTQKQRNIMKPLTGMVQKPGQLQKVNDKNIKRIQKLGQIVTQKEKMVKKDDVDMIDLEKHTDNNLLKNLTLNDECTIESVTGKKSTDIATLKNKWQMTESFTQVKKNLCELSKSLTVEKTTKKLSDLKYSNPVKRLETNPSISVRELFPGEEEMNLQCNIEFNNVKSVTPEGWEKCHTTVQYDAETKKLWNELQRPYGNQSSFLRHLVLLEKYFRNGDLVLAQNANMSAATYSDSVQSRLRAYDNIPEIPKRTEPISLIEFRKQKPRQNSKSLLKSTPENKSVEQKKQFLVPPSFAKPRPAKPLEAKPSKSRPLPPELIAINTPNAQGRKSIENVLKNIQQLVKGVSASDPTEIAAAPLPVPPPPKYEPPQPPKYESPQPPKYESPKPTESPKLDLPKPDTPKKQKTTSKPWRPTLMPITQENLARIAREPHQIAVDGRSLPSLVQVMSSGNRFHITLQDYNKMCIMRREKLQQLQDGEPKSKRPSSECSAETTLVTEIQTSTLLGNGGTVKQNICTDKEPEKKSDINELTQIGNAANLLKNVGLKNITIAPILAKTATVTSQTATAPTMSSSLLVSNLKIPQLGPSVSITSDTGTSMTFVQCTGATQMIMPKIPKSLTVIPQTIPILPPTVVAIPQYPTTSETPKP